jgi:hypothetical protein
VRRRDDGKQSITRRYSHGLLLVRAKSHSYRLLGIVHDLSRELETLAVEGVSAEARSAAVRLERREIFSVHRELVVMLYAGVATVVAGVGLLVKANLDRIGPLVRCRHPAGLAAVQVVALRRAASGASDDWANYVLLLAALLFSAAIGYAEVKFRLLGNAWSRHLLLLAAWHLGTAYFFRSRLVLSVALTAFATWMGAELQFGALFEFGNRWWGAGPRALVCAIVFYAGSRLHVMGSCGAGRGLPRCLSAVREFRLLGRWRWVPMHRRAGLARDAAGLALASGRVGLAERRELPGLCGIQHHRPDLARGAVPRFRADLHAGFDDGDRRGGAAVQPAGKAQGVRA